jgi:hypothetical protein
MSLFGRFKKKSKNKKLTVEDIIKRELQGYLTREDLQDYLKKIERDSAKKKLWDSLSNSKKIKLLRYVESKKGEQHEKK